MNQFSNEDIARQIGTRDQSILDKLINAYQLSKTKSDNNLTNQLRDLAIYELQQKSYFFNNSNLQRIRNFVQTC